jgi:predicted DNA-binding protein (MmcQ/YjbR family)
VGTAKPAAKADPFHDRLLAIVLKLPGAYEDRPWGSVHCKVDGKIFVGWGRMDNGDMSIGFRVDKALQPMLVSNDSRFSIAKYVGQHGGVDMRLGPKPDWREVETFIVESYRIIAPKKRVKELDARGATAPDAKPSGKSTTSKTRKSKTASSAKSKPEAPKRRA